MDRGSAKNGGIAPRHRPIERVVDLEDPRTAPEVFELPAIEPREGLAADVEHLSRTGVEEVDASSREVSSTTDLPSRLDAPSETLQARR